ncbi:MAG: hypothetical protein WCJ09_16740 [Planctomycetota bacterium]
MDFPIACECGNSVTVSEWSAGARIPCPCGRTINVPSSVTLRTNAGLPPVEIPLKIEVECLLESGELPPETCSMRLTLGPIPIYQRIFEKYPAATVTFYLQHQPRF